MPNRVRYGIGSGFGALSKELADQADEERRAEIARQSARLSQQVTQSHEDRARYEGLVNSDKLSPEDAAAMTGLPVEHFQRFAAQRLPNIISGLNAAIAKSPDTQQMGGPEQWKNAMRADVPRYTGPLMMKDAPPDMLDWKGSGAQDALTRLQAAADEHAQAIMPDKAFTAGGMRTAADNTPEPTATPQQFLRNPSTGQYGFTPVPSGAYATGPSAGQAGGFKQSELLAGELSPPVTAARAAQGAAEELAKNPPLIARAGGETTARANATEAALKRFAPDVLARAGQTERQQQQIQQDFERGKARERVLGTWEGQQQEASTTGLEVGERVGQLINSPGMVQAIRKDARSLGGVAGEGIGAWRLENGMYMPGSISDQTRAYLDLMKTVKAEAQRISGDVGNMSSEEQKRAGLIFPTTYDITSGSYKQKMARFYATNLARAELVDRLRAVPPSASAERMQIIDDVMRKQYQMLGVPTNTVNAILDDTNPGTDIPLAVPTVAGAQAIKNSADLTVGGQSYQPGAPVTYGGKRYTVVGTTSGR